MADLPTGFKESHSTVMLLEDEAIIIAFRRHTLLPQIEGDKPAKKKFKADPIGWFHNDIAEV